MNQHRFQTYMHAVEDSLLEEAQRPVKRRKTVFWACAGAACLALAVSAALLLGRGAPSASGDSRIPNPMRGSSAAEFQQLGYSIPLPAQAENAAYYLIDTGDGGEMAEVDFDQNDQSYICRAIAVDQAEDISGISASWSETLNWNVGTLELQMRQSEDEQAASVDWYATDVGIQWNLSGGSGNALELLHTAQDIVERLGYPMAVAPEGAQDVTYNAFALDDLTVGETVFTLDGVTYSYRTAATGEVREDFADISGLTQDFSENEESQVQYCPARIACDPGGAGKIVWFDVVPGLLYSLSMDQGASPEALQSMTEQLFSPAQGDVG